MTIPRLPGLIDVIVAPGQRRRLEALLAPCRVALVRVDSTPWFRPPDAPPAFRIGWDAEAAPGNVQWNRITVIALRRALGITATELAGLLNVTPRAVAKWEQSGHGFAPGPVSAATLDYLYFKLAPEQRDVFDGYILSEVA